MTIEPTREPVISELGATRGATPAPHDPPETHPSPLAPQMKMLDEGVSFDPATGMFSGADFPKEKPTFLQMAAGKWKMLSHYTDAGLSRASQLIKQGLGVQPKGGTFNPATGQFE